VLPRLLGVACVSLMGALTVAYVAYILVQFLPSFGIAPSKMVSQSIIIAIFLISFTFIFIPLLRRYVPTIQSSGRTQATLATAQAMPAPNLEIQPVAPDDSRREIGTSGDAVGKAENATGTVSGTGTVNRTTEESGTGTVNRTTVEKESSSSAKEENSQRDMSGGDDKTAVTSPKGKAPELDVSGEMLKFIRDSLEPLAKAGRPLNAFNRFGLTLFFAGAGEYMASRHRLSEEEITDILCSHVQILGHTAEMARGFCGNIDEYLVNPKYFQMYEKGRSALAAHMQNPEGSLAVTEAIDAWNEPAPVTTKSDKEFVAVLFTDIVGSTALTQERGDDAAQLVVHEHNAIVRDALALHGGKEIKHTGDGIMATFSQITGAVEGAVAMQEACQRANGANPDLGLGLCIGVNAGEPIHEDGDIFGTPVQMAARVLSKAEGDEIAVSNLVREMCTGKSYKFAKKGEYELKGFPEPVPIFLVEWKGGLNGPEAKT
jgi:adenylate cyclase